MNLITGITTKNEDWIIEKALNAVTKFSNKVIVYDDGSTDRTEEIARSYDNVIWKVRLKHDPFVREEAKQRAELLNLVSFQDPEYVLLLDADEIPTPNIVEFLNRVETDYPDTNIFKTKIINLWEDDSKYRVDGYTTKFGTSVNFNPFAKNAWVKYPLMKFNKAENYQYNLDVQKGGCSKYHPAPQNIKGNPVDSDFHIIHYGKIAPDYLNGERFKFYAKIEERWGKGEYEDRLAWHKEHNRSHTLKTESTNQSWFWK